MLVVCIKIFLARIIDVSLGTARVYQTLKGNKITAFTIAFVEVFIWFVIAREALLVGVSSIWIPISYALGYATGTYLGIFINESIINGVVNIQIIIKKEDTRLINTLRENGYALSVVNLTDSLDKVEKKMVFVQTRKNSLKPLIKLINEIDKDYFYTVHDTRYIQNGLIK